MPLNWRVIVAVAIYLFARDGELRVRRWQDDDIDLERGSMHINRAWDRRSKRIKATKTGETRRFIVESTLLPLLQALSGRAGGEGSILHLPSVRDMARGLRRWLKHAGVTRTALHVETATPFATTEIYIREAEAIQARLLSIGGGSFVHELGMTG